MVKPPMTGARTGYNAQSRICFGQSELRRAGYRGCSSHLQLLSSDGRSTRPRAPLQSVESHRGMNRVTLISGHDLLTRDEIRRLGAPICLHMQAYIPSRGRTTRVIVHRVRASCSERCFTFFFVLDTTLLSSSLLQTAVISVYLRPCIACDLAGSSPSLTRRPIRTGGQGSVVGILGQISSSESLNATSCLAWSLTAPL